MELAALEDLLAAVFLLPVPDTHLRTPVLLSREPSGRDSSPADGLSQTRPGQRQRRVSGLCIDGDGIAKEGIRCQQGVFSFGLDNLGG